ncbi:MAG: ABC transporter ATP-binding protein [Thermoplasmata archaeon]
MENLSTGYTNPVIKNLSFSLKPGNFLAVLGKNGSGKTTLLRAIGGTLRYTGKIQFCGREIIGMERREIAKVVGVVEQSINLYPFRVYEVVCMGRIPYAGMFSFQQGDFAKVEEAMKKVGIWNLRNRLITEISAGELQKTLIAKVLAQETKILLLDEPTSHLDLESQHNTVQLIKQLCREGKIVIAVFHDLHLAGNASHVLFLGKDHLFGERELLNAKNIARYMGVSEEFAYKYLGVAYEF